MLKRTHTCGRLRIEDVGKNVSRLKKGDPVYASPGMKMGAYVEYITLPDKIVAPKPENLNYKEAASAPKRFFASCTE